MTVTNILVILGFIILGLLSGTLLGWILNKIEGTDTEDVVIDNDETEEKVEE